jgi:hypothetical protein
MVLFNLDKGIVQQHEGKYQESDASFDAAERRMDELYTQSLTKAGGMLLLNDNTVDYAGEPYERALLNAFRAMNYVFLGKPDDALVESRKLERFLQELNDTTGGEGRYRDDPYARYLDALLFADGGLMDDARISLEAATAAYKDYASDYGTPAPRFDFENAPNRHGELVFVHYNGVAPRKVSKTFQIAWGQAQLLVQQSSDAEANDSRVKNALAAGVLGSAVTVSYPEYVQDRFSIVSSEVSIDGRPAGSTQLMENVSAIAARTLQNRMGLIKTRAIARATVKYILAQTAAKAAAQACNRQFAAGSWQNLLCKGATRGLAQGVAAGTETADTRSWTTLPAEIRMARVKVEPGRHDVVVTFKNAAGAVVDSQAFSGVAVSDGRRTYLAARTAQ